MAMTMQLRQTLEPAVKPAVARVVMPDGYVRFLGLSKAAAWLGVTPQHLGAVLRGRGDRGNRLLPRVREEFPELVAERGAK